MQRSFPGSYRFWELNETSARKSFVDDSPAFPNTNKFRSGYLRFSPDILFIEKLDE